MTRFTRWAAIATLATHSSVLGAQTVGPLIVHEWGTITTRHAPNGTPEGRLNHIGPKEVLPAFVHQYEPPTTRPTPGKLLKTLVAPGRPDVTMRLETPVVYFHPPAGSSTLPPFDVSVSFRGGVLNEFYPTAAASISVDEERISAKMQARVIRMWDGAILNNYVVGALRWSGISLKETVPLPRTSSHVWLAPRAVRSSGVAVPSGEGERYLFYRGVAHLDALLQTELESSGVRLRAPQRLIWMSTPSMTIPRLWFVDVRANGRAAFSEREKLVIAKNAESGELGTLPLFAAGEYSTTGSANLRQSMKKALTDAGLFDDEAEAMLETWRDSYFAAPGLRILYLVPNEWTSYFLPLRITPRNELTRVLVGRIDLKR